MIPDHENIKNVIKGHHKYRPIWALVIREEVVLETEGINECDYYAKAVKDGYVIG